MTLPRLNVHALVEDPNVNERMMVEQQALAAADPAVRRLLESIYLEPDRATSFDRFLKSYELQTILKLLDLFGVNKAQPLCEIGGGPGFLSWALSRSDFTSVHLMEPNGLFNTGTGYLLSRTDAAGVKVHNDLNAWHAGPERYDVVVTKNCIHHFKNIAQAAATIRQKMPAHGLWFAFREWFAETPQELYTQLAQHPYCQRYGVYEWPYPAWHYVEAIEIAGFTLKAIVPSGYANNTLADYKEDLGPPDVQSLTAQIDDILRRNPQSTVESFWQEVLRNRFQQGNTRFFSRPQLMVFAVSAP
ncbi:MAG: hypothetical protein SFV19_02905 [Rhodospirillaceae bacterium]|nr:hypothetical protein [Rhodospirillaceae bacterium]